MAEPTKFFIIEPDTDARIGLFVLRDEFQISTNDYIVLSRPASSYGDGIDGRFKVLEIEHSIVADANYIVSYSCRHVFMEAADG